LFALLRAAENPLVNRWDLVWPWLTVWTRAFAQGAMLGVCFAMLLLVVAPHIRRKGRLSMPLTLALGAASAVGFHAIEFGMAGSRITLVSSAVMGLVGATAASGILLFARRSSVQELDRVSGREALPAGE